MPAETKGLGVLPSPFGSVLFSPPLLVEGLASELRASIADGRSKSTDHKGVGRLRSRCTNLIYYGALYSDVLNGACNSQTEMSSKRYAWLASALMCASRLSAPAGSGGGSCASIVLCPFVH